MDENREISTENGMMRKRIVLLLVVLTCALPAMAGSSKVKGSTTLKDFQPAGTTNKKHKHQQFDFIFAAEGTQYTCRSKEGEKLKATDFPVGSDITYEVNKDKGNLKNKAGKSVNCTMMRIEKASEAAPAPASTTPPPR